MKLLIPLLAVILAGCTAKIPDSRIGVVSKNAPPRWFARPEAKTGIDTNWVRRIGGSRGEVLVNHALASNPDMRVAAERVNRAVASAKTAGASMKPQVSAGLNASRQKQIFVGFPFGGGGVASSISENFGANLAVSWEPDVWGFNRAGQAALIFLPLSTASSTFAKRAFKNEIIDSIARCDSGGLHGQDSRFPDRSGFQKCPAALVREAGGEDGD